MDLKGRGAIVTGSATGIGAAVARKLAQRGAKVAINYTKSEAEAKATLAEIKREGGEAILAQGDVAKDADCRKIADLALKAFGRIDILVNNAGTTKFADHHNLDALTAEDFQAIYAVNVVGPYQMIRAVAQHMKQRGYGAVVNVSSVAGVSGIGSSIAYAASKGALNTMTLSLSRALAPEVRVNAVCPGFVGTRWFKDRFGDETYGRMIENQKATTPLKRAGTPDDIADSVVFFCAEGAEHITGETLIVDAGLHLSLTPLSQR
jgi:3-oxoacyl-[acyl-carrier protein] reductase